MPLLTPTARRERFRAILGRSQVTPTASVWDAVSARLAEAAGFEVAILAGSVASHAVLGAPDITITTLSEVTEQVRRISRAASISLFVDADHGFGNALNVMRTIEELEAAGAAAVTIEDTLLPQPFGGQALLISLEEFDGKLRAAVAARRDPAFAIVGRTSALAKNGLDDALRRVEACERAGVDAIFIAGGATPDTLRRVAATTRLPLMSGGGVSDPAVLAECRCVIATWSHQPFFLAAKVLQDAYRHLYNGGAEDELRAMTSPETNHAALDQAAYDDATQRYLS